MGARPPPVSRRKRAKVSPGVAPAGTAKESELVPTASAVSVRTRSPGEAHTPSWSKSTQALSSAPAAEATTSTVAVLPRTSSEVKLTPSSSSESAVSSPSASAVGWPSSSASMMAPKMGPPARAWRAPLLARSVGYSPGVSTNGSGASPKSTARIVTR